MRKSVSTKKVGRRPVVGPVSTQPFQSQSTQARAAQARSAQAQSSKGVRASGTRAPKAPGKAKTPHRASSRKRVPWMAIGLALTAASVVSATAGALLAVSLSSTPLLQSKLSAREAAIFKQNGGGSITSGANLSLPELNRPVNILLLGTKVLTSDLDSESHLSEELGYHALVNSMEGLSDAMLLLRFDPKRQKLSLLSIPRDTRTNIPGIGQTKINEANLEGGPALAAQAVSDLLNGVGIDRYIRVNIQGIEKLIDALGGVEVYVPQDMKYQDDSQHLYINLKEGKQQLNGDQALQFLRFRYDNKGDIGRVQRQQMLMRAFIEQALTPKAMTQLPKVLSIVRSHLDTNLSVEELFALVNFASRSQRSDVQMLMVPGTFSDPEEYQASYWLPDYEKLDNIVENYFNLRALDRQPESWETDYADYGRRVSRSSDRDGWEAELDDEPGYESDYGQAYDQAYGAEGHSDDGYPDSEYLLDEGGLDGEYRASTLEDLRNQHLDIRISIQNSTGRELAVTTALDQLYEEGYGYLFAQEEWSESLATTRIVAQKGDVEGAEAVRKSLGMGEVVVDSIGDLDSDVTILLGRDWLRKVNRHSTWRDIPTE